MTTQGKTKVTRTTETRHGDGTAGEEKLKAPAVPSPGPTLADPQTGRVEHVSVAPCSFEFERTSKGDPKWTIKGYCEREHLSRLADEILALDGYMRRKVLGHKDGGNDAEASG